MNKMGMKQKLVTTFLALAIVPIIIIGVFATSRSSRAIEEEVAFYSQKIVTLMGKNVDLMIAEIDKEFVGIIGNTEIVRSMQKHNQGDMSYEVYQPIQRELDQIVVGNSYLKAAMIITQGGQIRAGSIKGSDTLTWDKLEKDGILEKVQTQDQTYWTNNYFQEEDLFAFRNIKNPSTGKSVGIAIFKVPGINFQKQMDTLQLDGEHSNIFLIDKDKRMVVNSNKSFVNKPIEEIYPSLFDNKEAYAFDKPNEPIMGKENFVVYTPCNNGNWQVVMTSNVDAMLKEVNQVKSMIWWISISIGIIAIFIAMYIAAGVVKPIKQLVTQMQEAEKGNLLVDVSIKGSKEIHLLGASFEHMIANIRGLITQTAEVVTQVKTSAKDVEVMASSSKETSAQVSAAIQEISSGATEQANEVEASIKQMQSLANTINDVVAKIQGVVNETEKTTSISNTASLTIKALNEQTIASSKITKDIEKDIHILNDNAKHIIDVIHLIEGISEQTNLLSLNAAIEAARAGAYGRGFGVVAEEVRKLAIQSKDATLQIRDIVEMIQSQTMRTVDGVQKASSVFSEQQIIVEKTNTAFSHIIQAMALITTQMETIQASMEGMESSKEQTMESMECIQTVVQQVVALTEELLSSSTEQIAAAEDMNESSMMLVDQVTTLENSIQEFQI